MFTNSVPLPMMWKNELVAKSESPTTAMRERRGPDPSGFSRRTASTMSVFASCCSPAAASMRSRFVCPQLRFEELTSGSTDVPGARSRQRGVSYRDAPSSS